MTPDDWFQAAVRRRMREEYELPPTPPGNATYAKVVTSSDGRFEFHDYVGGLDAEHSGVDYHVAFDPAIPPHEFLMEPGKTYTILSEYATADVAATMHMHRHPRTEQFIRDTYDKGLLSREEFIAELGALNHMDRKNVITHEIARLQEELAELSQFGDDEFDAFTVLRISMQYDKPDGTVYKYVAMKVENVWYTSARTNRRNEFTWPELVMWMKQHVTKIEVMDTSTVLYDKNAKIIEASPETEAKVRHDLDLQAKDDSPL